MSIGTSPIEAVRDHCPLVVQQNSGMETPSSQSSLNDNAKNHGSKSMSDPLTTKSLTPLPKTAVADYNGVQKGSTLSDLKWWLPELFASSLAFASLVSIVAVLRAYRGRDIQDVQLPRYLTLNGLIAIIATISRAALMVPVGSVMSQECWLWLSKSGGLLVDIENFDDASRGAWGSLQLLFRARLWSRWLALYGALVTILCIAFGTFTQQVLVIRLFSSEAPSIAPGNIQRAQTWQNHSGNPAGINGLSPPLVMKAAIANGALTQNLPPLIAPCLTGNCTWPSTATLSVCGACTHNVSYQTVCFQHDCEEANSSGPCPSSCNYTMPSGSVATLVSFTDLADSTGGVGFEVISDDGAFDINSDPSRLYIAKFDVFGAPASQLQQQSPLEPWANESTVASECALWFCIQTINISTTNTQQKESVIGVYSSVIQDFTNGSDGTTNVTFDTVDSDDQWSNMRPNNSQDYNVRLFAARALSYYLSETINGNVTLDIESTFPSNDIVQAIWENSADLDAWIQNLATSMSNLVRQNIPHSDKMYNGKAYYLGYDISWPWLIGPTALVLSSLLMLVVAIVRTRRRPIGAWKGSPLVMLFMKLDPAIRDRAADELYVPNGLREKIGDCQVTLRKDVVDSRIFRRAVASGSGKGNEEKKWLFSAVV